MIHPIQMRGAATLLLMQAAKCAEGYKIFEIAEENQHKLYLKWAKLGLGIEAKIADRLLELNEAYGNAPVILDDDVHKILHDFIDICEFYDTQWQPTKGMDYLTKGEE